MLKRTSRSEYNLRYYKFVFKADTFVYSNVDIMDARKALILLLLMIGYGDLGYI